MAKSNRPKQHLAAVSYIFIELVKGLTLKNNVQATQAVKLLSRVFHKENNLRYKTPIEKKAQRRKIEAVKEYQAGFPGEKIIEKYDIRSLSQLKQWSIQYNNDELKTKSRKRVRKMGRKVSFEEKCKIVQWVLDHDNDYQGATIQFNVSYRRVYSWVRKYHEAADSWEALKDNRGHRKPQKALEEMTEKEQLEAEIKRLKKINREMELEIAFAKKLVEIRNRGVKRPDDIKRFKN